MSATGTIRNMLHSLWRKTKELHVITGIRLIKRFRRWQYMRLLVYRAKLARALGKSSFALMFEPPIWFRGHELQEMLAKHGVIAHVTHLSGAYGDVCSIDNIS
jgi:hypothetical protein